MLNGLNISSLLFLLILLSAQQEYSNYMLQLASIESSEYGKANQRYIQVLRSCADFKRCCDVRSWSFSASDLAQNKVCVWLDHRRPCLPIQLVAFFLVFLVGIQ